MAERKIEPFQLPYKVYGFSANLPDAAEVYALHRTAVTGQSIVPLYSKRINFINQWLESYHDSLKFDDSVLEIVRDEVSDEIIAIMISEVVNHENRAWIYSLAVDEKYRKKGIGRMLVQKAMECAADEGVDYLELAPTPGSLGFYHKLGFLSVSRTTSEYRVSVRQDGQASSEQGQ